MAVEVEPTCCDCSVEPQANTRRITIVLIAIRLIRIAGASEHKRSVRLLFVFSFIVAAELKTLSLKINFSRGLAYIHHLRIVSFNDCLGFG